MSAGYRITTRVLGSFVSHQMQSPALYFHSHVGIMYMGALRPWYEMYNRMFDCGWDMQEMSVELQNVCLLVRLGNSDNMQESVW